MPEIAIPISENKAVKNIIMLLQSKGAEQEKQDVQSLVRHIESMETQFSKVFNELQDVKAQLQTIQNRSVQATARRIVNAAETKITEAKNQLTVLKGNIVQSFTIAAKVIKQKGISALRKTVDFFKIHSALSHLKGKLDQAATSLNQGAQQIQKIKNELHTAKDHVTNAARLAVGKGKKEISTKDSQRGVLTAIQRLMLKGGALLNSIGKTADSAIRKVEALEQKDEKSSVRDSLKEMKRSRRGKHSSTEKTSPDKTR